MTFPAYGNFTATSWPSLASIPVGWEARRLKFCVSYNDETLPETTDPDLEIAYVDISSVDLINGITTIEILTFENAPSRARRIVRDGDTIISTVRTYLKAIAPIEEPMENMIVSTGFAVIRPLDGMGRKYLGYALQGTGFIDQVVANSTGVSYPAINPSTLVCIPVSFPVNRDEQERIGVFLDWKTGQIDALIAKKRELVEKLKEKRIAVITQAVTKGLDSSVPMRNSGIDWLGQVPRHWIVKRLRFVCTSIEQGWSPQCENQPADDDCWGVMKVGCVNGDVFDEMENKALPLELEPQTQYELMPKDILISRANTRELLGSAAIVPAGVRPKLMLCDKLYRVTASQEVDEAFLTYYLRTPAARFQYEREATGASSSMKNIGQDTIRNLVTPLPPLEEQKTITAEIDQRVMVVDSQLRVTEAALAKLAEYRTALITAATTGKIDVRGIKLGSAV